MKNGIGSVLDGDGTFKLCFQKASVISKYFCFVSGK